MCIPAVVRPQLSSATASFVMMEVRSDCRKMYEQHPSWTTRDQDETRRRKRCNLSVRTNPGNCFPESPLQQSHLRGAGAEERTVAVGNNTDEWASAVGVVGTGSIISGVSIFHSFGSVCYRRSRYSVGSTISRTCGANWRNVGSHVNLPPPWRRLHSWTGSDDDLQCLNK